MQTIIKISEAAAIALHAANYLAQSTDICSTQEMAKHLGVSSNHLSKVLQTLTRSGLVTPLRGPKGGFTLSPSGKNALLRDIITAIDGPPKFHTCLMKAKVCRHRSCMFGDFMMETNKRFKTIMNKKISAFNKDDR